MRSKPSGPSAFASNTSLVLRHNYAGAEDNIFSRTTSTFNLDNNGFSLDDARLVMRDNGLALSRRQTR